MSGLDPRLFAAAAAGVLALGVAAAALRPRWVVARPRWVLALLLLPTLASAAALVRLDPPGFRLAVDPSTEPLLPARDPERELYRSVVRDFGDDEVYVIAVECEDVFTYECLSAMRRVSDAIARLPGVRSVSSLLDVTSFRYVPEEDWVEVRPFIEEIPRDPGALRSLRERATTHPVYRRTLVAPDARAAALDVSFRKMSDAEFIEAALDRRIRSILDAESREGLRFHVAGRPHVKTHVYHGVTRDLLRLIPLAVLVVAAVLFLFSGALRSVLLPLGAALVAVGWTFGAMALLGSAVTLLTGLLAPTLLAIGSVYGVHVLSRYEEEAVVAGERREVVRRTMEHLAAPVCIAGATTLVGFAALLVTDVPAVFELGAYSALGIGSITLLSLTGIPALLVLLPIRGGVLHGRRAIDRGLDHLLAALGRRVARHAGAVLLVSLLAGGVAAWAVPRIAIDTDYLSFFDPGDPVRRDFEAVNRLLAGAVPIYVVIEGDGAGTFRDPAVLRAVEDLQQRFERVPGVSRTLSSIDTMRVLNRAFHADDPAEERIPDTAAGVTELLFMIPKPELSRFTTVDHARANLIVRTGEVGSAAVRRLVDGLERAIAEADLPAPLEAHVAGNAVLLARSADGIARSQPKSVLLAACAIFVLIALGLRSPRLGAIAMVPNLLPVLLFFGLLGLGVASLSLPTSLIGSVALGVAIDDTVHFLVRYRAERRAGASPEQASLRCGRFVGRPIAITSVMLSLGFLAIAFSRFATLREFGVLSAVTMALCLVADLILLPALLHRTKV